MAHVVSIRVRENYIDARVSASVFSDTQTFSLYITLLCAPDNPVLTLCKLLQVRESLQLRMQIPREVPMKKKDRIPIWMKV
jgi:hypothetical protein